MFKSKRTWSSDRVRGLEEPKLRMLRSDQVSGTSPIITAERDQEKVWEDFRKGVRDAVLETERKRATVSMLFQYSRRII